MRIIYFGAIWIAVFLLLATAPLIVLLMAPGQPGREFWREFSVALAFAGLSIAGLQFIITARLRYLTWPFGLDVVYHFHRRLMIIAVFLILAHPTILIITDRTTLELLHPAFSPWRTRFAVLALGAFAFQIVTSVWRLNLGMRYEPWRITHNIFAILAVGLAVVHAIGVGHYMATPTMRSLILILAILWLGLILYVRLAKPNILKRRPYKVTKVVQERGNAWSLYLEPDGHPGMRFHPGQFSWITIGRWPDGITGHPFSITASALNSGRVSHTIKALGDFTSQIKHIAPGTPAYLDGPHGSFSLDRHVAPGYVFIAGGIGITPIMSMLRTLADRCDSRQLLLIYGNKTWEGVTFREELEDLKGKLNLEVVHLLEEPPPGWEGESGFITPQLLSCRLPENRMEIEYFICGPPIMIDVAEKSLLALGISMERMHSERFQLV